MHLTPLFTVESFSYTATNLTSTEMASILQKVAKGKRFKLHYRSPYYGKWRDDYFYVGKGSLKIGTWKENEERYDSLSFNMIGGESIAMIKVSNEFLETMKERTDFSENAEITFSDGTILELKKDFFTVSNNYIVDGAGNSTFPLGDAVERNIQIELMNDEEQFSEYVFCDAKIRLFLTFDLSESTEKIEMGTFTVLSPETYGETVIVTAVDEMYKADVEYTTNITFPATTGTMLRDSCDVIGIPLGTVTFDNDDFVVNQKPEGITHRQLYGYIAMLAGGNARISRQGELEIIPYDFTYETVFTLDKWKNLKTDTENITITGIKAVYQYEETETTVFEGTEGYVIKVENPLISGQEQTAVSLISEKLIGAVFRQFEGDHIGCPVLEFMDPVQIIDRKGRSYTSVITDINFAFYGFTTIKNSSEKVLRKKSSYPSVAAEAYQKARKLVIAEKTARETAIKKLEKTLSESSGLYVTEKKQDDGSTIFYLHDKPTLAESSSVMKVTADAVGLSTDGGKTYPAGFTIDGEMIAKILQTEGVNATWINTGEFVVKDKNGNIIFSANVDTGQVIISGDSVKIGNNTLTQELENLREKIGDSTALTIILDNEYQGISTDYQGNYTVFPETKTTALVLYGQTDISEQCTYAVTVSAGLNGSWDKNRRTYTVTELLTDDGWVDIKATYLGKYSVTKRFTLSKVKGGMPGIKGDDAILLQIDSSNGNIFKNSSIATILTVTIIVGDQTITSAKQMKAIFGENAKLVWKCRKMGEAEFSELPSDDTRLSDSGFIFTLQSSDVENKVVFSCDLDC